MSSPTCTNFFTCDDARKHLTLEQVLKMMIIEDENGCPTLKTASVNSSQSNSGVGDVLIEEDDNTALLASITAWRLANPTKKQVSIVNVNSINKQAVIISYTS